MSVDFKKMCPRGIRLRDNSLEIQSSKTVFVDGEKKVQREFSYVPVKLGVDGQMNQELFMQSLTEAIKVKTNLDAYVASSGYGKNKVRKGFTVGKVKETVDALFAKRWAGTSQERNVKIYTKDILNFFPHDARLDNINTEEQRDLFIQFCKDEVYNRPMNNMNSVSNKSINVRLGIMRAVMAYAIKEGLLDKTKVIDQTRNDFGWTNLPQQSSKKKQPLTEAEIQDVYNEAVADGELEFADAFIFLCDTGMRHQGEFFKFNIKNAHFKSKTMQFWREKTSSWSIHIPMTDRVFDILKKRREQALRNGGKVFDITQSRIRTLCKRYKERCDLPEHFTPYATRHTFITRLVEANNPPNVVRDLAGHSCIETTLTFYAYTSDKLIMSAIQSINNVGDANNDSKGSEITSSMIGHNSNKMLKEGK